MSKRGNFEDHFNEEWKEAFSDFESPPPSAVWDRIDKELTYNQLKAYKKRAAFYQLSTAAAFIVATFFGVIYFFSPKIQSESQDLTANSRTIDTDEPVKTFAPSVTKRDSEERESALVASGFPVNEEETIHEEATVVGDGDITRSSLAEIIVIRKESELAVTSEFIDREIYLMPSYRNSGARKPQKEEKRFWAAVDFGAGNFDPGYQPSTANTVSNSLNLAHSQFADSRNGRVASADPRVLERMSDWKTQAVGVEVAMKLSDKLVIESGARFTLVDAITYTNAQIRSSQVVEPVPVTSQVQNFNGLTAKIESADDASTFEYKDLDILNQFQFTSIPVKAGYFILDERVSLMISAGVSANIYMGNKLSIPDTEGAEISIGPGENSPYRDVSLMGLAGIQLGYNFLRNFDVTVEPYYRETLTELAKENSQFSATPSGFGVNTGIRYRFN